MPTNHTANYQLSQWEKSDKVQMEDFNADNAKIDEVLGSHAAELSTLSQTVSAHGVAIARLGNCQIYTTEYVGDGTYGQEHPLVLSFPRKPALVIIFSDNGRSQFNIFPKDMHYTYTTNNGNTHYEVTITWAGNTVSCYANSAGAQMNYSNYKYQVVAFCAVS